MIWRELEHMHHEARTFQTTERYLGSKQKIKDAVNDHIGVEPAD
jgi:hypothetical protein